MKKAQGQNNWLGLNYRQDKTIITGLWGCRLYCHRLNDRQDNKARQKLRVDEVATYTEQLDNFDIVWYKFRLKRMQFYMTKTLLFQENSNSLSFSPFSNNKTLSLLNFGLEYNIFSATNYLGTICAIITRSWL